MIGIQESIILIALIVFCFGIPLLLRGRYPLRQWLGILLCFVFGAVGQLYLAGGFLYFIGIGIANGIVIQTFRTVIVQEKMTDGEGLASMIIIWMLLNLFSARIMERRFKKLKTRANPATPLSANHDNNRPINPSANSNNARMTGSPVSSGSDTIPCPHCGETIKRIAKLCKHCRRNPTIIEEVICEYCGESTDGNADKCKHCDSSISPPTRKQVSASMPNKEAVEQETIENKEANRHDEMKQSEFKFNCPKCKQEYEADESMCGQTAECSNCNSVIIVPTPNKELVPKTVSANIQSEQARRKIIFTISLVLIIVFIVVLGLVTLVNSKCRENLDPQTKEKMWREYRDAIDKAEYTLYGKKKDRSSCMGQIESAHERDEFMEELKDKVIIYEGMGMDTDKVIICGVVILCVILVFLGGVVLVIGINRKQK